MLDKQIIAEGIDMPLVELRQKRIRSLYFQRGIGVLLITIMIVSISCKKLVEVGAPKTANTSASVYTTDATAAVTTLYAQMINYPNFGGASQIPSLSVIAGLSADEFSLYSGVSTVGLQVYYQNNLNATGNQFGTEYWTNIFIMLYTCNAAIEGITNSDSLTPTVKQQLLGESKFVRAFCYLYLVNLYGEVPVVTSTNFKANSVLGRAPKIDVYNQIILDLKDAQNLLSAQYLDGTLLKTYAERVRPTTWAATALLARAYLYMGDLTHNNASYANAELEATKLISNTGLFSLSNIDKAFLKFSLGNPEAIWQLQPVVTGSATPEGTSFDIPSTGPFSQSNSGILISSGLLNSFETNDLRKTKWIGSITIGAVTYYYPNKYKIYLLNQPVNEYSTMLRLGEQYLIRAEARAQQGKTTGVNSAESDLNAIRSRAGLTGTTASTQATMLSAILRERQVELFSEMGHRWFDLKRTGNIDAVMSAFAPQKGSIWKSYQQYYPIPLGDLQADPNIIQNTGY